MYLSPEEVDAIFLKMREEEKKNAPMKWETGRFTFEDDIHDSTYESWGQKCPFCQRLWRDDHADYWWKFCPNCGQDMRKESAPAPVDLSAQL